MIIPKGNTRDLLADLCHWVIINGTVEEIWSCQTSLSVGVLVHLHIALTTIVKLIEQGDGLGICIKKLEDLPKGCIDWILPALGTNCRII